MYKGSCILPLVPVTERLYNDCASCIYHYDLQVTINISASLGPVLKSRPCSKLFGSLGGFVRPICSGEA
jgi:hypothetical protein